MQTVIKNAWLFLVVVLISIFSLIPPWFHYDIISRDGAFHYIPIARMYLDGKIFEALSWELPVYPVLLAGVAYLTDFDFEFAGRIISAIFYVLSAIGLFKLTQAVFKSKTAALIAVVFMITNRDLMELGVDCLKETIILCMIIWASYYWVLWILNKNRWVFLILSLSMFLVGCLIRSTSGIFLLSCFIAWLISEKKWKTLCISISSFILIIGLIYYLSNIQSGFLRNYNPSGLEINDKVLYQIVKYLECYFTASNPVAIVLAVFGVILLFKQNIYAKLVTIVFLVSLIIFSMRYYISDRYMMPMVMMLYPISAYVVLMCLTAEKKIIMFIGVIAIIYSIAQWGELSLKQPEPRRLAIKQTGQWIYKNYGSNIKISANQDRIIYYSGVETPLNKRKDLEKIDLTKPSDIIAVDVSKNDGTEIKKTVEGKGYRLKKEIYPIFIYSSG